MTCLEKMAMEHPKYVSPIYTGGAVGCPHMHGYATQPSGCGSSPSKACYACWQREVGDTPVTLADLLPKETTNVSTAPSEKPRVLDSGERREFGTGAVRDIQEGKGRCDLMPLDVVANHINDPCLMDICHFEMDGSVTHLYFALTKFSNRYGSGSEREDLIKKYAAMYLDVAHQFEDGAKKYGEHNWQKGIPVSCYIDSAVRHYLKLCAGWTDEPHDRAFVWNLMCCIWTCEHKPELNTYAGDDNEA